MRIKPAPGTVVRLNAQARKELTHFDESRRDEIAVVTDRPEPPGAPDTVTIRYFSDGWVVTLHCGWLEVVDG